jgi:hypothetical protein
MSYLFSLVKNKKMDDELALQLENKRAIHR